MKGCRALSEREIDLIRNTMISNRDKALVVFGVRSGLRISELLSLTVGDVYRHGRVVDLVYIQRRHMKKKTEGRALPVHAEARAAIQALIEELESKGRADAEMALFQSRKGQKAISRQQAHRILKAAAESNELTGKIACHSLRKSFAARIYSKVGGDLVKTQKAMGHKSIFSTMSYLSTNESDVFEAILAV